MEKEEIEKIIKQLEEEQEWAFANFEEYIEQQVPNLDAEYADTFELGLGRAIQILTERMEKSE